MSWIWLVLAVLLLLAGFRYVARIRSARGPRGVPVLDDDGVRRILETGAFAAEEEEEPLDLEEAARAEDEFWDESWDEPEEYGR
jgi:hypothetical protein